MNKFANLYRTYEEVPGFDSLITQAQRFQNDCHLISRELLIEVSCQIGVYVQDDNNISFRRIS